jgi:hypothetical protein
MTPNTTDRDAVPPSPAPKTPAVKGLDCDHFVEKDGTYTAVEFRVQDTAVRRAARIAAGPGALKEALAAVARVISVKKKCPERKYTIRLGLPSKVMIGEATATTKQGQVLKGYSGYCSCDWRIRVECVEDEITGLHPTGAGSGVVGDPPIDEQDLECDDEFVGRAKAFGAAADVNAAAAIRRASEDATGKARQAATAAINGIACIKQGCPVREITLWLGPAPAAPKSGVAGFTIAAATCPWAIRVTCQDED